MAYNSVSSHHVYMYVSDTYTINLHIQKYKWIAAWKAVWNENIPCHVNQEELSQPSAFSGFQTWMRAPKTEIQQMLPPPLWLLRSWGNASSSHLPLPKVNKETGLAPNSWGTPERNEVRELRGWHFPVHRMLNSLTWYLIFDVQTACSLCCKLVYSLTSSLPPWSSFLGLLRSYDWPRQHTKKQRHYFANKGPSSQSYGFSSSHVWMWELNHKENCVEKLMLLNCGVGQDSRVPWTVRRLNDSILKEISPECTLEGLMLKLKLQYFGHLMRRADSLEKTLMLGKIEGRGDDRGWDGWMASPSQWTWVWVNSGRWRWTGRPGMLQSMGSRSLTRLSDWTDDWTKTISPRLGVLTY